MFHSTSSNPASPSQPLKTRKRQKLFGRGMISPYNSTNRNSQSRNKPKTKKKVGTPEAFLDTTYWKGQLDIVSVLDYGGWKHKPHKNRRACRICQILLAFLALKNAPSVQCLYRALKATPQKHSGRQLKQAFHKWKKARRDSRGHRL